MHPLSNTGDPSSETTRGGAGRARPTHVPKLDGDAVDCDMDPQEDVSEPSTVALSVIVPVFNEEGNVGLLLEQIYEVLAGLKRTSEVIVVDDGSSDDTFMLLRELARSHDTLRLVRLRRNFGQTAALSAGLDESRGEVIVTMDGDLQNDPKDIPRLLALIDEGFDLVSGWRKQRQDRFLTRVLPSRIANWIIGKITGVRLHDYGCSLKAYRREVIRDLRLYGEMHRFMPALVSWYGAEIAEIPVNHKPRQSGTSKYGLSRTLRVVLDLITVKFLLKFATRPLHSIGMAGLVSAVAGVGICGYLSYLKFFEGESLADRPLLWLGVLGIITGIQMITMGLLAELLVRTYHESQGKPIYVVREKVR